MKRHLHFTIATGLFFTISLMLTTCQIDSPYLEAIREQIEEDIRISENPDGTYSVIYNGNGHTGGEVPVDEIEYEEGDEAIILGNVRGLEKTGYSFTGWNEEPAGEGAAYNAEDVLTVGIDDITLYAQWLQNDISIVISNPLNPIFNISPDSFALEVGGTTTRQTVGITADDGITVSSYEWFVNGESRGTWSSLILNTEENPDWFLLGTNSLTIVVIIEDEPYSDTVNFIVEEVL